MEAKNIILTLIGLFFGLPVLFYLCSKFGTYGYYKAKQKANKMFNRKQ